MASKVKKKTDAKPASEYKPAPDIKLPDKIATRSVTAKSLAKGSYQKALLAAVAPMILPDLMNSIRRNLHLNDSQTQKLAAEIFGMTGAKGAGIVLNVNQNNQNVSERPSRHADGPGSFEEIQMILEEEEKQRKAIPASFEPVYEITPDAVIE